MSTPTPCSNLHSRVEQATGVTVVCRPAVKVARCPAPIYALRIRSLEGCMFGKSEHVFDCYQPNPHVGMHLA